MAKKKANRNRDDFIRTFVNQMYGILIGIGIGSILFDSGFDISNWFGIVMVIYVTAIVLIYWWDWIEYIEDEIVSTKSETIIDFIILINLEMLFVNYNNPKLLSISLIFLGILDLIWVINHIIYNYKHRKEFQSNARCGKWIMEKIFTIALYTVLFLLVIFILPSIEGIWNEIITIIMFGLAFIIVRLVSFREVSRSALYQVRKATDLDSASIVQINHSYFSNKEDKELIKMYTVQEILTLIKSEYVLVATNSQKVVIGYIICSEDGAKGFLQSTDIKDQSLAQTLEEDRHVLIEQIAIEKNNRRDRIGTLLMKHLKEEVDLPIISYISKEPYFNEVSAKFHLFNGFRSIGRFSSSIFGKRQNYVSELYLYANRDDN